MTDYYIHTYTNNFYTIETLGGKWPLNSTGGRNLGVVIKWGSLHG